MVGIDVHSKEIGSARRVFMAHTLLRGPWWWQEVSCARVPGVQGEELIFVYDMVVEKDAKLKAVEKVLKEAPVSAKPVAEGRDALGVRVSLNLGKVMVL